MSVLVDVNNLDQFVKLLSSWHQEKVTALEHMLQVPEGVEVTYQNDEPVMLSGDLHKGFIIGLTLGLMELGALPFVVEFDSNEQQAADDTQPKASYEQLPLFH